MFKIIFFQPIFNLLLFFYNLVGDFGLAVILFVILIKILTYPLTKMQFNQMRLMRKIQPEINKINKKYADNKQKQYLMQMALRKKNGIKGSVSLFSTLIQLPIFISMFQVISSIISNTKIVDEISYGFIKNLTGIKEIIADSGKFQASLFGIVDLSQSPFKAQGLSLLVLMTILALMALSQYHLSKMMQMVPLDKSGKKRRMKDIFKEAAEGKEPDQAEMSQIMSGSMAKFFPAMMFFSFGVLYGVVSFYSLFSNLVTILQYKFLEKHSLPETQTVEEDEIKERLSRAENAQIINEQRLKKIKKMRASKTETDILTTGERITRIKAKK